MNKIELYQAEEPGAIKTVTDENYFMEICKRLKNICPHLIDFFKNKLPRVVWKAIKNSGFLEYSNFEDFPCRNWMYICSGCVDYSYSIYEIYTILKYFTPENATLEYIKNCKIFCYQDTSSFDENFYSSILSSENREDPHSIKNEEEWEKIIDSFEEFFRGDLIESIKGELDIPVSEKIDISEKIIRKYPDCCVVIKLCGGFNNNFKNKLEMRTGIKADEVSEFFRSEVDYYIFSLLEDDDIAFMFSEEMEKYNIRRSRAKSARK